MAKLKIPDEQFCVECGAKCARDEYRSHYDVDSGAEVIYTKFTCPNKRWWNLHYQETYSELGYKLTRI